jgi:hypothetical protein
VAAIQEFLDAHPVVLARMGNTAQLVLAQRFTQDYLCGKFCGALERAIGFHGADSEPPPKTHQTSSPRSADAAAVVTSQP